MTKKKLSLLKAFSSLAIIVMFLAFCAFFFTYGRVAIQNAIDKLQAEPVPEGSINLSGLGPAILLVLAIIAVLAFIVPAVMSLIAMIGNFTSRGNKLVGFTVVGLISEIFGVVVLLFINSFFMEATLYDVFTVIVLALFDLVVLASFVMSILVLVKQKTALDE